MRPPCCGAFGCIAAVRSAAAFISLAMVWAGR
jgi:hypothetical protein